MPEVLEIEVDGQPLDEAPRPRGDAPSWGLPVAIALVGLLTIAVLVAVVVPALTGSRSSTTNEAMPPSSAAATPTSAVSAPPPDERLVAAEAALDAWGEFAVTGNFNVLGATFDPAGPQYAALSGEVASIVAAPPGPPPYEVALAAVQVALTGTDETVVSSSVTWSRSGETARRYEWEIVLRRAPDGRWLLWTVRP